MCIVGDVLNVSAQFQSRAVPPVLSRDPQRNKSEIVTRVINCTFLSVGSVDQTAENLANE